MAPKLSCQAFHLPKAGHAPEEYEDAWAIDLERGRFAVADGASESSYAGLWARLLVKLLTGAGDDPLDRLAEIRAQWSKEVDGEPLPWFAEEKRLAGAFATWLALEINGSHWGAAAVGDCCLFHLRNGKLIQAFPLDRPDQFTNRPSLLASRPGRDPLPAKIEGECSAGDRFLLATDAVAEWLMREGDEVLREIDELKGDDPQQAFADWITAARRQKHLRNDDVTLVVIDLNICSPHVNTDVI